MWLPTLTECLLLRDTLLWMRIETNALHCPRGAYSLEKKLYGKTEGYSTHPNTYSCDFRFLKYNLLAKTGNLLKHYHVTVKWIWEKKKIWEFPGNPVRLGLFCVFTAEHLVWSLVGELRSYKWHGTAKKIIIKTLFFVLVFVGNNHSGRTY